MNLKVNDTIKVITGNDKGSTGKVLKINFKQGTVLVEGINQYQRHLKAQGNQQAGIVTLSRPISASKVMVVCPHCGKSARPAYSGSGKDRLRLCRKCQKPLDQAAKPVTKKKK